MSHSGQSRCLTVCDRPTEADLVRIGAELHAYNAEQTGGRFDLPGSEEPGLVIERVLRGPNGDVVGGIGTSSILGVMWLETLWVADEHRRKGLASWLVLEAERIAHEKGCVGAGTWTFSWQGADFYPTIGYRLNGVYDGYPFGVTEHVLTKRLPDVAAWEALAPRVERLADDGFELVERPTRDDMRTVCRGLHAFCQRHAGEEMDFPGGEVRRVLKDRDGRVVGGVDAFTTIRVLVLEALWIDRAYRGQGYGRALLADIERVAAEHGCVAVSTHCLSFQSPGFFRQVGYESFGTVDVYLDGHTEDLLIKRLAGGDVT